MEYYVDEWLSQRRFNTVLLEIFAGLALVLGMMGIYGVLTMVLMISPVAIWLPLRRATRVDCTVALRAE
jgi:ABC-type lipoprotein release transport system permease subunit